MVAVVGRDREVGVGVCGQHFKKVCGDRQYRSGLHKIIGLEPSANYVKRL